MLLQSGLQPTIDCLDSVDKQKILVDIFLDVPPSFILSFLSSSYTFYEFPCFLDEITFQLMPSLYPDKDRVNDCI